MKNPENMNAQELIELHYRVEHLLWKRGIQMHANKRNESDCESFEEMCVRNDAITAKQLELIKGENKNEI